MSRIENVKLVLLSAAILFALALPGTGETVGPVAALWDCPAV